MKPSFSLKWLFVGIALLALVLGWIVDRRRLTNEQRVQLYLSEAESVRHILKLGELERENAELRKQLGKTRP